MRNIFHAILARYLESEQHAFEASSGKLWPAAWSETRWQAAARAAGRAEQPDGQERNYGELEPQNCS
jgi:hypothetical protein